MKRLVVLLIVLFWYFLLSFWNIHNLPSDWFGDISIEHEYITQILHGEFPWQFDLSAGPFYHYSIAPIIAVIGQSYLSYKIASILFGSLGVIGIYLCGYILGGTSLAGISAFIASSSFWYLVWVHLGSSPQLATPVIFVWSFYFLFLFEKKKQLINGIIALLISGLGLLTYPASFLFPLVIWIDICILVYPFRSKPMVRVFTVLTVMTIVMYVLFGLMVKEQLSEFTSGYIGGKIPHMQNLFQRSFFFQYLTNYIKTLGMFFVKGDSTFRTNVPVSPHIDIMSAFFIILGIVSFAIHKKWKIFMIFSISLLMLLLPSSLPSHPFIEIPNSGRTLCIVPIVYLFIGYGIQLLYKSIVRFSRLIAVVSVVLIMGTIAGLNMYKYFIVYPTNLPNDNKPYGLSIARYIDLLPSNTTVHLTSCCWGDAGQPEPKAIYYQLINQTNRWNIVSDTFVTSCEDINDIHRAVFVFSPLDKNIVNKFQNCFPDGILEKHMDVPATPYYSLFIP